MQALRATIIIVLQVSLILCKRRYRDSSSEESIENVLYYQDCQHRKDQPKPVPLRALEPSTTKKPQECKMCCTMCCGDECQQSGRPMSAQIPRQPAFLNQPKKIEPARPLKPRGRMDMQLPFFGRRDAGVTKDNIKSLISKDMDIRKILKDLVRVTMQKVDLMQLLKSRTEKPSPKDSVYENDL